MKRLIGLGLFAVMLVAACGTDPNVNVAEVDSHTKGGRVPVTDTSDATTGDQVSGEDVPAPTARAPEPYLLTPEPAPVNPPTIASEEDDSTPVPLPIPSLPPVDPNVKPDDRLPEQLMY